MPGIVEFPLLVQRAVVGFSDFFYGEPQRQHFAEYLTGLFIAEGKTVSGINREFVHTTDQSCLNRFITEVDWAIGESCRAMLHETLYTTIRWAVEQATQKSKDDNYIFTQLAIS